MSVVRWERDLADLPSVAFKVVQLALLDVATLAWGVVLCFVRDSRDTVPIYNAWLIYVAALHGVNLYAFRTATQSPTTSATGQQLPPPLPTGSQPAPAVPVVATDPPALG